MKKVFAFALSLIFAISSFSVIAMGNTITISVNDVAINFSNDQPFVDENNRIQVPVRTIAESLGKTVNWLEDTKTVVIGASEATEGESISFVIGSNKIRKNEQIITMDTEAVLKDDRIYVPLRYVAESLNYTVEWNNSTNNANLTSMAQNGFDLSLLQSMPKDENYMISPFSLKMALAMVANGADGDTKHEILNVLGISDLEKFNQEARDFILNSNKNDSVTFNIANSIWHNSDYYKDGTFDFADVYKSIISDYFLGTANEINNANGAKTINNWISKETFDKINNVVDDAIIKDSLSLLVNTIYFKGDWYVPFSANSTNDDIFTDRNGNQKTIEFMNDTDDYNYFENNDFQMLAKPYRDYSIKMYFVLPKIDNTITQIAFENAIENMTMEHTIFNLPKFKTEYLHTNLIDILKNMGIQTAFNLDKADFLNMYSKKPIDNIYVSSIMQKTFIEVDEKGTEAAAATVFAETGVDSIPSKTFEFKCDKPFTYFIRNDATGDILFMGEYAFVE